MNCDKWDKCTKIIFATGPRGPRGFPGPAGSDGATGSTGPAGTQQGPTGLSGALATNPSNGEVLFNTVLNTRGYVVDRASVLFSGNSWGIPENAVDIALLSGTQSGAPYDPTAKLSQYNSAANISDQR